MMVMLMVDIMQALDTWLESRGLLSIRPVPDLTAQVTKAMADGASSETILKMISVTNPTPRISYHFN
jgi:hypothetical protein